MDLSASACGSTASAPTASAPTASAPTASAPTASAPTGKSRKETPEVAVGRVPAGPWQGSRMSLAEAKPDRPVDVVGGNLRIRLAEDAAEIRAAQALRYRVFYESMAAKRSEEHPSALKSIIRLSFA